MSISGDIYLRTTSDVALAGMLQKIAVEETERFPLETPGCFSFVDPFMQPRGAPSTFGNLKEEPLRASWPAMLVDPSWYVQSSLELDFHSWILLQ